MEHSFDREGLLSEVLALAFGSKQTAGLVWMLGLVMDAAGRASQDETVRRQASLYSSKHWLLDPTSYRHAREAAYWMLRSLDPPAYPSVADGRQSGPLRARALTISGTEVAKEMLGRAFGAAGDQPAADMTDISSALKKLFGPQIAERLSQAAASSEDAPERESVGRQLAPLLTVDRAVEILSSGQVPSPEEFRAGYLSQLADGGPRRFALKTERPKPSEPNVRIFDPDLRPEHHDLVLVRAVRKQPSITRLYPHLIFFDDRDWVSTSDAEVLAVAVEALHGREAWDAEEKAKYVLDDMRLASRPQRFTAEVLSNEGEHIQAGAEELAAKIRRRA